MKKRHCYIFAAGDFNGTFKRTPDSFIIAADAGYDRLFSFGLTPDLLIGDFDSISDIPVGIEKLTFPSKKDFTDTHLAIDEALKRGFKKITVIGAFGGQRLDHTISNIQSAVFFSQTNADITFTDGINFVKAIRNGKISFDSGYSGYISVFCFSGKAEGVSINGLKYELTKAVLTDYEPLGVSNEFTGKTAEISVENGTLIIIYQKQDFEDCNET